MGEPAVKLIDFTDKNAQAIMKRLYHFYTKGLLCDAEIIIGNNSYFSHKLILRANGEYFKENLHRDNDQITLITDEVFDKNAIDSAIGFFYHGALTVMQFGEMIDMIKFARLIKCERLESYCLFALDDGIGKGNFKYAIETGEYFNNNEMLEHVQDYLLNRFVEAVETDDFLDLSEERVTNMINDNDLRSTSEIEVFEGIKLWINHNWAEREKCVESLISKLRMPLFPLRYLFDVVRPFCETSLMLCNMLIDTAAWHTNERCRTLFPLNTQIRHLPKVCVLAIGGDDPGTANVIEFYDPYNNQWGMFHRMMIGLKKFSAVYLDGKVMWFGGERETRSPKDDAANTSFFSKFNHSNEVWNLDLASVTVSPLPAMRRRRSGLKTAVVKRLVYVFGGNEELNTLRSVARWNPRERSWTEMAPMLGERYLFAAVVHKLKIYIIGRNEKDSILEVYDTETNEWAKLPAMRKLREACCGVCVDDYIYVIGGVNGVTPLNTVERYNIKTKIWDTIADMPINVWSSAAVTYHNKIIVVGGYGNDVSLEYDIESDTWKNIEPLKYTRYSHDLLVIPPEYVFGMN